MNSKNKTKQQENLTKSQDTTKMTQEISKGMPISEILDSYPEKSELLAEIMFDFGIHCVGCGASMFETLEEGVLGHGFTEKELNKLVKDLNEAIAQP